MNGSYSVERQVASLSFLANFLFKAKRPFLQLESVLKDGIFTLLVEPRIQELIGEWEVVWGPIVYAAPYSRKPGTKVPLVPDNVCYVVKTHQFDTPTYLIAIAGTNTRSIRENICDQDLKVKGSEMVTWSSIVHIPGDYGKIALGTKNGLETILHRLEDKQKGSLRRWLYNTHFEPNAKIITAGHSLGAALCTTLAVWMVDTIDGWNAGQGVEISTYPTAGPTPGDRMWTSHAMKALENRFFGVYNTLDPIALAWDKIEMVENLYTPYGLTPSMVTKMGIRTLAKLPGNPNPYAKADGWRTFDGDFEPNAPGSSRTQFINQVIYQHVAAYIDPMGYREFVELQKEIFPRPVDR